VPNRRDRKFNKAARAWLWIAALGLVFGAIGFGEIAENRLRALRNSLHVHPVSGDIVVVSIDDRSLSEVGSWPWPRSRYAELADRLTAAGAKRIFFDIVLDGPSNPDEDRRLAESLSRSSPATIPVRLRSGSLEGEALNTQPLPQIARHAELGSISVVYNYENAVWTLDYGAPHRGTMIPTFAAKLAGARPREGRFMIDYSADPATIPLASAAAVLNGETKREQFAGKDVIIAATSEILGDQYFLPGWGKLPGAYVQVLGAETLEAGEPIHLGWLLPYLLIFAGIVLALSRRSAAQRSAVLAGLAVVLLAVPVPMEANLLFVDVVPSLFAVLAVATVLGWRRYRRGGLINPISELPNLNALRASRSAKDQAIIAARVHNYAEIVATLPPNGERQLIEQIVSRLRVGAPERVLHHGEAGVFAWFEEAGTPFAHHLDALYALFRNPARVAGSTVDVSMSFGIEVGSSRSLGNRLASAILAAEEAAHDGLKWKYHDPETLKDASWKLSILSQLDAAVDKGEIWVAFQPKLDVATRRIIGAEALARWTHPEKGPIAASEFIVAAEQHDRIAKLTDFVLEKAIGAAAQINAKSPDFHVAVNLSARLLSDKGLLLRLSAMLARHSLPARCLTLELTETAELTATGTAVDMLAALRDLGVTISIDDYGTGQSTMEYLKKIPATEIKIDQSFVKGIVENRSDRLMVQSTIGLAHSLGRKVVAEGVEHAEILEVLAELECDIAQGFAVGRPMSLESLLKRITQPKRRHVA
jgi:diguanylate cyclase